VLRIKLLIALMFSAGFVATDIYLPSLPAITKSLHTTVQMSQLSITFFLLSYAISQFFGGVLSDKYGRKPIGIVGLLIFIPSTLLPMFAHSIDMLLLGRFLQGLGIGALPTLGRAIARDSVDGPKLAQVLSFSAMFTFIVPAVAPVIGGVVQTYFGFRYNFLVMLLSAIVVLVVWQLTYRETNKNKSHHAARPKVILKNLGKLFSCRIYLFNAITAGLSFAVVIAYSTVNPFLLENVLHYSPSVYGWMMLIVASGLILGFLANGRLVNFFKGESIILAGMTLLFMASLALIATALLHHLSAVIVVASSFLGAFGASLVGPNAAANALSTHPEIAGTAGATFGLFQVMLSTIVTFIISGFHASTQMPLGLMFLGLVLAMTVLRILLALPAQQSTPSLQAG